MAGWQKWLWSGVGWSMFGPLGAILGYALGSKFDRPDSNRNQYTKSQTRGGDFGLAMLVLLGAVMKADKKLLKSELDYVKQFLIRQFGAAYAGERMQLFKDILKQDYPIRDVCLQIKRNMDHPSRLELIHLLFGLSQSDGEVHPKEVDVIHTISRYMGISEKDFQSIQAMFYKDLASAYRVLDMDSTAADSEIKKAYRRMASKYHPDKVHHLGEDFQKMAEEKFKKVNEAYTQIKRDRGFA